MEMWELVQNEQAQLGESPSWNEVNQVLYWIDSKKVAYIFIILKIMSNVKLK